MKFALYPNMVKPHWIKQQISKNFLLTIYNQITNKHLRNMNYRKLEKIAFLTVWGASQIPVALVGLWPVAAVNVVLMAIYALNNKFANR